MIGAALTRCRSMIQTLWRRCAREVSRWSRGTLMALVGFGSFLMLMGGLFTYGMAAAIYVQFQRHGFPTFPIEDGHYGGGLIYLFFVLLLMYGGNFVRGIGWFELRRRRLGATAPGEAINGLARQSITNGVLAVLVGLVLFFWGAMGLASFYEWFHSHFGSWPTSLWGSVIRSFDVAQIWSLSVWWTLVWAWLAGGVVLLWSGSRAMFRRVACNNRIASKNT